MSWRDALQLARFRDAPFHTESSSGTMGRRVHVHEYPKRDLPYPEDLGGRAEEFTLEAYCIGPDYMSARDALRRACRQPGPGTLVHPYLGTMRVQLTDVNGPRESSTEGGMARFTLQFVEAGENRYPSSQADTPARVRTAAASASTALHQDLAERWNTAGPEWVRTAALGDVANLIDVLEALPPKLTSDVAALGETGRILTTLRAQSPSLIGASTELSRSIHDAVAASVQLTPSALAIDRVLPSVFAFDASAPLPAGTPLTQRLATNRLALAQGVRRQALVDAARVAAGLNFTSFDEAAALRDDLAERLDLELHEASDLVFEPLRTLRAEMVRDITARGADLARLVHWSPKATVPALVAAHRIYGDATRADEVLARNGTRHPGFVPGGRALEVLADV